MPHCWKSHATAHYYKPVFSDAIPCQTITSCPNTWVPFESSCYLFSNAGALHFTEAEQYCRNHSGYLVTIETDLENAFLTDYASRLKIENYWIGLAENIEGEFRWNNSGPTPTFFDWGPGEPNGHQQHENCVDFYDYANGIHWNDRDCAFDNFPLCEKSGWIVPSLVG